MPDKIHKRTRVSRKIRDHEGKYLVAMERNGLLYFTAHRPETMADAMAAAASMFPTKYPDTDVVVLRVLGRVTSGASADIAIRTLPEPPCMHSDV